MKPLYLFSPVDAPPERKGKRFVKELLRQGSYQHPTNPWPTPLEVTERKIDELVENTMSGLAAGVKVPFPTTHNDGENPESNRGFFDKVFKAKNSKGSLSLYGEVEVTKEETAEQVGRDLRDVSVYINDFGSGNWTPKGDRIVHACITNYPVFADQENFVALSAGGSVESTSRIQPLRLSTEPTRNRMKITAELSAAAKSLGVTLVGEELTPEALTSLLSAAKPAPAPTFGEADVPKALSVDPSKDRYFSQFRKQADATVALEVETAEKAGRLTKDMADAAKSLLSVTHGYGLSVDGKATQVDVPGLVRKMLAGIPDRAVVPVTPDPAKSGQSRPQAEGEKFAAENASVAARILSAGKKS